jgi:hypothetical protein
MAIRTIRAPRNTRNTIPLGVKHARNDPLAASGAPREKRVSPMIRNALLGTALLMAVAALFASAAEALPTLL